MSDLGPDQHGSPQQSSSPQSSSPQSSSPQSSSPQSSSPQSSSPQSSSPQSSSPQWSSQQWSAPGSEQPPSAGTPPPPPPPPPPPGLPLGPPLSLGADPELTLDSPAGPRRNNVVVAVAVVAVLALGLAGVFAVSRIGRGDSGGAASPEAVGAAMMASLEQEDVLGMIDLLLPGERNTFRDPLVDIVGEFSRLEVLSDAMTLSDLSGFDFELTDEVTTVSPTNVDDIVNITMSASMTASVDGAELPIGDLVRDLLGEDFDTSELSEPSTDVDFELPMTVVERDGRWYLSVFYTAAESARGAFGDPIPERGIEPAGGDSPEGAVDVLLDGVERLDLGAIIAAINPDEAEALQRYAPMFLDDAQRALAEAPLSWEVTGTEYEVTGSGSTREVDIVSLRIDGVFDSEPFSVAVADGCVVIAAADQRIDSCEQQSEQTQQLDELFGDSAPLDALITSVRDALADYDQPGIVVRQVDGRWYVSPIGSGFAQILALLAAFDRAELDAIIIRVEDAVAWFFDGFTGSFPGIDDGGFGDDPFGDDPFGDDPFADDVLDDPFADDVPDDSFAAELRIAEECLALGEAIAIADCIRANIATGALPEYYLSIELEHPECGVAGVSTGAVSLYDLTDEEYTALVEAAAECFGALIASGDVEEIEVPAEYLRPECSEGRNPWDFEADDANERFDRWLECVYS